ncbi:hypothetical protein MBANPS3_006601 [Mucor bainieri]
MSSDTKPIARKPSVTKRKSLLSELGIQAAPGGPATATTKPASTSPPSTLGRKTSMTNKPSSPSVSRTRNLTSSPSPPTATARKKVAPSSIKVDRTTNVSGAANSPTSPNPKRRSSIVPTTSNTRASMSPLARRTSVNVSNSSSGASVSNKRMSTPAGLESLAEVQTIKDQLVEKDNEIQSLKESESKLKIQTQQEIAQLEAQLQALKDELKLKNAETNNHDDDDNERIKEAEDKLGRLHKAEMDQLLEDQDKRLEAELAALRVELNQEYDAKIQQVHAEYNQKQEQSQKSHDLALLAQKEEFTKELNNEKELHDAFKKEHASTVSALKQQIQDLQEAQTNSHMRKVQNELEAANAALEELKRQSQHTTESLEKRYREEIRQLQNGSDDTAQAWLEKTRSAQQELDQLHDQIQHKGQLHAQAMDALKQAHAQEMDQLSEACENKETQIEEQSSQIEDLLYQVETLQNSLEAATVRLEHTAKSTPTTSSNRDDINDAATPHQPIKNIHQDCLDRLEVKQKELEDLKSRLAEVKETHETQMNRMAQEKANALQELRKKVTSLEQKLAATTPPSSPTRPNSTAAIVGNGVLNEERLIRIAEQHRQELKTMHEQYQIVVDAKDRELEDYAYRVKALVAAKQKDIEKLQTETNHTIDKYERDIEGYEAKIVEYEKECNKLQDRVTHWETISNNNNALLQDMKRGCTAHVDENAQLISTGASAGIGEACAKEFAKQGSNLILAARRSERLEALKKEILQQHKDITVDTLSLDVRQKKNIDTAISQLPQKNDIDILVNNAGLVIGLDHLADVTEDAFDTMFETNVKGLVFLTQAILPGMKANNKGHIINIGSVAGKEAYPGGSIYCGSKHAVDAITRSLIHELMDTPIRVSQICPGMVNTEFSTVRFDGDKAKADNVYKGVDPLVGQDIAELVTFTASRPPHVNICDMLVFPTAQAAATTVYRRPTTTTTTTTTSDYKK